jgi:IS605 OrfB family transposase
VKLIVQLQLRATPKQKDALARTMRTANAACDWLSSRAFESGTFAQYALHKLAYASCRQQFGELSSQAVVRCIAKVADTYKLDRVVRCSFRPLGSIAYDARILSWQGETASIWTVDGRQRIPFVCGDRQRELLQYERGETDLVLSEGRYYLFVTVDIPDTKERKVLGWLGVDVGVVNIATTSDGSNFAGAALNAVRARANVLRKRLQQKGTKSAKRLLKKRRRKESRFASHVNHQISKQIVTAAERTDRGIALENLEGIRARIRASRSQRRVLHSWSFADLQDKLVYKAQRAGVAVCFVDPRNTSRECRVCGHAEKANRRTRDQFACKACGHTADADANAACVIAGRAAVNRPYAGSVEVVVSHGANCKAPSSRAGFVYVPGNVDTDGRAAAASSLCVSLATPSVPSALGKSRLRPACSAPSAWSRR